MYVAPQRVHFRRLARAITRSRARPRSLHAPLLSSVAEPLELRAPRDCTYIVTGHHVYVKGLANQYVGGSLLGEAGSDWPGFLSANDATPGAETRGEEVSASVVRPDIPSKRDASRDPVPALAAAPSRRFPGVPCSGPVSTRRGESSPRPLAHAPGQGLSPRVQRGPFLPRVHYPDPVNALRPQRCHFIN